MRSERLSLKLFVGALARSAALLPGPRSSGARIRKRPSRVFACRSIWSTYSLRCATKNQADHLQPGAGRFQDHRRRGGAEDLLFCPWRSTLPITLGLLIDTSGSESNTLGAEQEAAVRFLSRVMRKGDLAMVVSFDTDSDLLADLTDDQSRLDRAINRARINAPSGQGPLAQTIPGTVFYDAVYAACHDKLASEAGRKAVVILTDAQDEGSTLKLQDAIEAAQRTDTVVHVLLIADPRFGGGNESVARKLTDETGGRTIVVRNEKKLEEAFDQISEELRSQYTIGYYSSNPARDGGYRKVKVDTTRKDLDVLTRRGYYAPKN